MRGQIWSAVWADTCAFEPVGESASVVHVAGEPTAHGKLRGESGVQRVPLIVVHGRIVRTFRARIVSGICAGEAASDTATLLGDLVGISQMKLPEVGQSR